MNILLKSVNNFRDAGAYKNANGEEIRNGLLFRSGHLFNLNRSDSQYIKSLGIRTIIDLRTVNEARFRPDKMMFLNNIERIHIPIKVKKHNEKGFFNQLFSFHFGEAKKYNFYDTSKEIYREFVTDFCSEFGKVIEIVSDKNKLPVLIHCSAGKDRTGFVIAIIQFLLGISEEDIFSEYLLTNKYMSEFKKEIYKQLFIFSLFGIPRERFLPLFEAEKEYLESAFIQINEEYGSIENYICNGLKITDKTREHLRLNLLEK